MVTSVPNDSIRFKSVVLLVLMIIGKSMSGVKGEMTQSERKRQKRNCLNCGILECPTNLVEVIPTNHNTDEDTDVKIQTETREFVVYVCLCLSEKSESQWSFMFTLKN